MSVTTHERPGVYSEYDASSVVQGRQGRKMVGMAAIHATAPAGAVSYTHLDVYKRQPQEASRGCSVTGRSSTWVKLSSFT